MERTLLIVKPDAVAARKTGLILATVEEEGFTILAMEKRRVSEVEAKAFYEIHKEKPFYDSLVDFMTSGPVVLCALEKANAVADLRALVGDTDPARSQEGTIRRLYGSTVQNNAVHASDSVQNGLLEVAFFFSEGRLLRTK